MKLANFLFYGIHCFLLKNSAKFWHIFSTDFFILNIDKNIICLDWSFSNNWILNLFNKSTFTSNRYFIHFYESHVTSLAEQISRKSSLPYPPVHICNSINYSPKTNYNRRSTQDATISKHNSSSKEAKPSDTLFKKALSAIQSACSKALPSTQSAKYASDHSFVIVGVGLDKNLDKVKAATNKTYPAKISLVRIRSQATQAPTRLLRAFTRCETTKTLLIDRGLMIGLTHHRCEESRQAQTSSPPPHRRAVVIQCYPCQGFGYKANACIQEARCSRCGCNHKLAEFTVPEIIRNAPTAMETTLPATRAAANTRTSCQQTGPSQWETSLESSQPPPKL